MPVTTLTPLLPLNCSLARRGRLYPVSNRPLCYWLTTYAKRLPAIFSHHAIFLPLLILRLIWQIPSKDSPGKISSHSFEHGIFLVRRI